MTKRVTAQDVANRAGVSRATVSLVLNGRSAGMVSVENQAAVLAAAAELDYRPNSAAVNLRRQSTRSIGVVTDAITTTAFGGRLLAGAGDVAVDAGYVVVVMDTRGDDEREALVVETFRARQVDAVMYAAMSLNGYRPNDFLRGTTSVLANCFAVDGSLPAVYADEVAGGRSAARVLLDAGHRDVVLLAGTADFVAAGRRVEGFRAAMAEAGLPAAEPVLTGWEIDKGYAAAMHLLDRPDRPTGVLCANDRVALGVVLAAARLCLDVPGDVSVVGYDDDENVAPAAVPPLTTVALPHEEIGRTAMAQLLARLAGAGAGDDATTGQDTLVPCPVVVRGTVGPPSR